MATKTYELVTKIFGLVTGRLLIIIKKLISSPDVVPCKIPIEFNQVSLEIHWYPFILLDGGRHCESEVSWPRTQHK